MRPIRRTLDVALAAGFAAALLAPASAWLCDGIAPSRRLPEERMSTSLPAAPRDLAGISEWPRGFEAWFGDALGLRTALLELRSRVDMEVFGVSPTSEVVLGRDDWVFLTGDRSLDAERGAWPMSRFEVERWAATLDARARYCRSLGSDYVFVLVPDKPRVYADLLPAAYAPIGPSRLDQIAARMQGDGALVDLRAALDAARRADGVDDHTFYPYGSHWTDRGTAAGFAAILERLRARPRFASLQPFAEDDLGWWTPPDFEGDNWAPRLYVPGRLIARERAVGYVRGAEPVDAPAESLPPARIVTRVDDPTLPRILVFHDSFGQALRRFVAHRAARAVCLWGEDFSPQIVAAEKPDLVMELFVDRKLARMPVQNLPELEAGAEALFEAATETAFVLDPDKDARAMGTPAVSVTRVPAGLRVSARERGVVQLPAAALPLAATSNAAHALVRIEIDAQRAGNVLIMYRTPDTADYKRRNSISRPLVAGHNRVFVDLGIPDIRGPLALNTDVGGEPYTIVGVEVRLQR
jgi:hypothetical protein